MGNHCIDCEFCGQDRRRVGTNCCKKYEESERAKQEAYEHRVRENSEFLAQFGLQTDSDVLGHSTKLEAKKVAEFLRKTFPSTPSLPSPRARELAEVALRLLGKEDLIFPHHGEVVARPEAYTKLAEFFEKYAIEWPKTR